MHQGGDGGGGGCWRGKDERVGENTNNTPTVLWGMHARALTYTVHAYTLYQVYNMEGGGGN